MAQQRDFLSFNSLKRGLNCNWYMKILPSFGYPLNTVIFRAIGAFAAVQKQVATDTDTYKTCKTGKLSAVILLTFSLQNTWIYRSSRQHLSTKGNGGSEASNKIANCGMIRSSSQHLALILYYMLLMLTVMLLLAAAAHEGIVMDGPNTQVPT